VLTREGVTSADIGLSREFIAPATAAVAGYFLVLNLVGAGLAIASGHADTIGYQCPVPPAVAIVFFFWMLLIAGLVEGSSFGAISRRSVSRCWGGTRFRIGVGVVLAGLLFSISHIPRVVVAGAPVDWGPSRTWGFWRSMVSSSASSTSGRTTFGCLFSFTRPAICPEQLAFSFYDCWLANLGNCWLSNRLSRFHSRDGPRVPSLGI